MDLTCQHCGTTAAATRTMCPSCRRRMVSPSAPVAVAVPAPAPMVPAVPVAMAPAPAPAPAPARQHQFGLALALSVGIAVAGVAGWAILAEAAHVRTVFISFGVAAGMAAVMRRFAATHKAAPAVVVVLTAISAVVGLLASQYALVADAANVSITTAISKIPTSQIPDLLTTGTTPITWVIMLLSVVVGFRAATSISSGARAAA